MFIILFTVSRVSAAMLKNLMGDLIGIVTSGQTVETLTVGMALPPDRQKHDIDIWPGNARHEDVGGLVISSANPNHFF